MCNAVPVAVLYSADELLHSTKATSVTLVCAAGTGILCHVVQVLRSSLCCSIRDMSNHLSGRHMTSRHAQDLGDWEQLASWSGKAAVAQGVMLTLKK